MSLILLLSLLAPGCGRGDKTPPQPIEFKHSTHAQKKVQCLQCHEGAEQADRAGMPAMSVCVRCHFGLIPNNPEVQKVLAMYAEGRTLRWRKVNVMPSSAMVHFEHKPHARAGIPCRDCHGDVEAMTVASRVIETADMRFCMDCHRRMEAGTDCLVCHH